MKIEEIALWSQCSMCGVFLIMDTKPGRDDVVTCELCKDAVKMVTNAPIVVGRVTRLRLEDG